MANQSKAFRMINGVSLEQIVNATANFLKYEKGMDTQGAETTEGYVMQASQAADGWKTFSGTRLAITIQYVLFGDTLNVTVGEGQWSDKIGAGAVGWFVAWPLAVTAGIGAYKQKKLPDEIFAVVEKTIFTGGQQVVMNGAGQVVGADQMVCPACRSINPAQAQFCSNCGSPLKKKCSNCGAILAPGGNFCSNCGAKC